MSAPNPQETTPDDLVAAARAGLVYGEEAPRAYAQGDPVMTLTLDAHQAKQLVRALEISGVMLRDLALEDIKIRVRECLGITS